MELTNGIPPSQALSAILRRRRLPLATPEWKTVPWQSVPKDMKDILVDVLVELPGLVEDLDTMRSCVDQDERDILQRNLVARCWECDAQLMGWSEILLRIIIPRPGKGSDSHSDSESGSGSKPGPYPDPGPRPDPRPNPSPSTTPCKRAASSLESSTSGPPSADRARPSKDIVSYIAQVHGMGLFWIASLVLYTVLHAVTPPEQGEGGNALPERRNTTNHARKLVDAIGILLQPEAGLYGRESAALMIDVALEYTALVDQGSSDGDQMLVETLRRLNESPMSFRVG
jgi:hypothetical protein